MRSRTRPLYSDVYEGLFGVATEQNQVAEIDLQLCPVSYILKFLGITDLLAEIFRLRN
ncbi:hypothetical protein [Nostoc sp.]|uniref:hypothetical protein n=1 Tax=Nostoc sp. TaxID=1180 RepID=UPI002FFC9719